MLGDIMAQLQHMDARLDTFSIELYQVNVRVNCIARQQATMGGFSLGATPSSPPPMASDSEDEDAIMVMTMMLRMRMMEMLALPMRCLLNTLILCHS